MKRYTEKICEDISVEREILFATNPGYDPEHTMTNLYMDMYQPAGDTEKNRRSLIFVHGGGFLSGNRGSGYPDVMARTLASYGYVCFSIDYRLFIKGPRHPGRVISARMAAEDIDMARVFITRNADRFGIDPEKMSIGGGSAGGMGSIEACKLYHYQAFVCLWGTHVGAKAIENFVPTIIIHGTADQSVPYEAAVDFHNQLEELGVPNEFVTLADAPHTAIGWLPEYEEKIIRFLEEQYTK